MQLRQKRTTGGCHEREHYTGRLASFYGYGWLQTYWLFSFSDDYDPANMGHGKLRVFNDDVVRPRTGFPTHPHEEMEIITIVLKGEITHKDSMGNGNVLAARDQARLDGVNRLELKADQDADFILIDVSDK